MNIYVGNLPFSFRESDLRDLFSGYDLESASVISDRETGRSRGFGFVEITDSTKAARAIEELNGHEVDGRRLSVNEARPRAPRR
ncbi:MAG: RNA-binding protein [Acidimicrobiia bacterium]|jgi:RNA recognition motif-containing protein